jgi:hypothetical protein
LTTRISRITWSSRAATNESRIQKKRTEKEAENGLTGMNGMEGIGQRSRKAAKARRRKEEGTKEQKMRGWAGTVK